MRAHDRGAKQSARSLRRPPFALSQTQHTERTTAHDLGGNHQPQDDPKWERERARSAAPPAGGAEVERPTRENNATQPTTTLPVESIRGSLGSDREDATVPENRGGIPRYILVIGRCLS